MEHVFSTRFCTEDNISVFKHFDFKFILKHIITMYYKVRKLGLITYIIFFEKKSRKKSIFVSRCSPLSNIYK